MRKVHRSVYPPLASVFTVAALIPLALVVVSGVCLRASGDVVKKGPAGSSHGVRKQTAGEELSTVDQAAPTCSPSTLSFSSAVIALSGGDIADVIEFENTSQNACSVAGYPDLEFVTATGSLVASQNDNGIGMAFQFEPLAFQSLSPGTASTIPSGKWGGAYLLLDDRASDGCPAQNASVKIGWSGATTEAVYPSNRSISLVELCPSEQVELSVLGPVDPSSPFLARSPEA